MALFSLARYRDAVKTWCRTQSPPPPPPHPPPLQPLLSLLELLQPEESVELEDDELQPDPPPLQLLDAPLARSCRSQ